MRHLHTCSHYYPDVPPGQNRPETGIRCENLERLTFPDESVHHEWRLPSAWSKFLYPMSVYFGVLISMRLLATAGNRFGNRSIPEYLGDRYGSDGIRVLVAIFSLVQFFYLAGQLVSGLVMF